MRIPRQILIGMTARFTELVNKVIKSCKDNGLSDEDSQKLEVNTIYIKNLKLLSKLII